MIPRMTLIALSILSLTGCAAAVPMAMQLAADPNSMSHLCSMTKVPGQTASLCDHFASPATAPAPAKQAAINTAAR
jgi:hypothetical protein